MGNNTKRIMEWFMKFTLDDSFDNLSKLGTVAGGTAENVDKAVNKMVASVKRLSAKTGAPISDILGLMDDKQMANLAFNKQQMLNKDFALGKGDTKFKPEIPSNTYGKFQLLAAIEGKKQEEAIATKLALKADGKVKTEQQGLDITKKKVALSQEELQALNQQKLLGAAMNKDTNERLKMEASMAKSRANASRYGLGNMQEAANIANLASPTKGNYSQGLERTKTLLMSISKQFGVSTQEAAKFAKQMQINDVLIKDATASIDNTFRGLAGAIKKTFANIQNYISTAFGVSMAMLLFKAQMAVSQFFTDSLKKARELRDNLRELKFSEGILSKNGVDITIQGLKDIAKEIERLNIGLSKTESIDLMGKVAQSAKSILGMTADGLRKIALSVAYIQSMNPAIEAGTVVNAILDKKDTQINQFVQFNEDTIRAKAKELGYIKDINANLSDQAAQLALIEIIYEGTGQYADDYAESIKGTSKGVELASMQAANSLKENVGGALLSIMTQFQSMFLTIAPALQGLMDVLTVGVINAMAYLKQAGIQLQKMWDAIKKGDFGANIEFDEAAYQKEVINAYNQAFKDSDSAIAQIMMAKVNANAGLVTPEPDTPTGTVPGGGMGGLTGEQVDAVKKGADDILKDMNDMYKDLSKMEDEYLKDSARAWEDYQQDLKRLKEDYDHDVLMAGKESNDDLAQENADYANEELEAALKFEEEMRQLRQKFLFDLEDALASRDARQVIRLQKQYAMDFTNKTNEFDLERQERLRAHELELNDIKNQTSNKLAELKYEYDLRVIRMQEENALERQRRDQDHIDDMKRREQEMLDRITMWGIELETEYGVKTEGVKALYDELSKFYGTDGKFNVMYRGSFQDILNMSGDFQNLLNQQLAQAAGTAAQIAGYAGLIGGTSGGILAGMGAPVGNFMPLGAGGGGAVGGGGGGIGQQGQLAINVNLSPNLEATIVNNAINGVAEVITNAVNRGNTNR